MVLAEVAFKVHVVLFYFGRESLFILKGDLLIVSFLVTSIVLNDTVKLLLKNANCFNRILRNIPSEIWTELSQLIKINLKALVLFRYKALNGLLLLFFTHELSSLSFHDFFVKSLSCYLVVSCVDLHLRVFVRLRKNL